MKFNHLLPPRVSSPAQFTAYWVCVKDKNNWYLSKDGDIKFAIGAFGRGEYNQQFWFDYDFEAWYAIIEYYHKHEQPFPYANHIINNYVPVLFHEKLLTLYGKDNMWWDTKRQNYSGS